MGRLGNMLHVFSREDTVVFALVPLICLTSETTNTGSSRWHPVLPGFALCWGYQQE